MTLILRQSTARDIRIGPFVDATDAVSPEVGITIGTADQAEVLKHDGAATVAMTGTLAAVSACDGWYDYTAATTDVDTVGEVVFVIQDSSVSLPCFTRGYVVEEAVYDAFFAASGGMAVTLASGAITAGVIAADAITAAKVAADVHAEGADAVWDEDIEAAHGTDATSGLLLRALGAAISNRSNNATLDALLGVGDTASNDVPNQILDGDTLAELVQGIPDATPTLADAIMLVYMALRNDLDTTAILKSIKNDAGTVIAKATLSDDGTTFTKAEFISGA